jgi:hypothetical protein
MNSFVGALQLLHHLFIYVQLILNVGVRVLGGWHVLAQAS